jgi:hypothetical protein
MTIYRSARLSAFSIITLSLAFSCLIPISSLQAAQKKKQKKSVAPPTAKPVESPTVAPATTASKTTAPMINMAFWNIEAMPYAILGGGRPGKTAVDFDKPDGVAFMPNGWLLATDAKNRRVQIWDVKTKQRLGEFGHGIFGGEVVDIAVTPNGLVLVTDQILNLAYAFEPPRAGATDEKGKPLGAYDFQFKGTRFGEQGFDKLGGIAVDMRGRIYLVDAHLNEVRRFTTDFKVDPSFKFERARSDGNTYLHGCEGIAIEEKSGLLFIASEKDSVVQVFDLETGAYKKRLIGAGLDANGLPTGKSVFSGSVEGLAFAQNHLFAVDESVGQIQIFDLTRADVYNTDLNGFQGRRNRGYRGFFGHSALVDFEDKKNAALQQQLKEGVIIPGQVNPPGYFCSPDAIAAYTDAGGETFIAIADQCNYRLAVYRWSDLTQAISRHASDNPADTRAGIAPKSDKGNSKKKKGKA